MYKILIVDYEADVRAFLERFFKELNFEVIVCTDGEQAIKLYGDNVFDIVLMSIEMKKMDGFEVLRRIISIDNQANIIMLGEDDNKNIMDKVYEYGAKRFIHKPLILEELESAVFENLTKKE